MTIRLPPLEVLEELKLSGLKALYREHIGTPPPDRARKGFLVGNLGWALQARQYDFDHHRLREQMCELAEKQTRTATVQYLPGTRMIREWNGVTHEVVVEEKGFRWQNRHYRSLSRIAREITGARWSGPRFFGITRPSRHSDSKTNGGS